MKGDLRRAGNITDAAIKRGARVTVPGAPPITGSLVGVMDLPRGRVALVLIVGGARAVFPLDRDAEVTVWRKEAAS